MRWASLGWLLAGCFAPTPPSGVPCAETSENRCPTGQVCVTRGGVELCEAPGSSFDACASCTDADVDVEPDVPLSGSDGDNDMVDDAIDNCPLKANTDQVNEDNDASGDVCDKCPADVDQGADMDGDGVGDACDPRPGIAGDVLVAFHSFTVMPSGWTTQGAGTVALDGNGSVRLTGGADVAILATASPASGNVEVRAAVTPEAVGGGFVGVLTQHAAGTDNGVACQLASGDIRLYDSGGTSGIVNPVAFNVVIGTRYELRVRRSGTQFTCRASNPPTTSTGTIAYNPAAPQVGLRARTATARYHWVMIISSP